MNTLKRGFSETYALQVKYQNKRSGVVVSEQTFRLLDAFTDLEGNLWPSISETAYKRLGKTAIKARAEALIATIPTCDNFEQDNDVIGQGNCAPDYYVMYASPDGIPYNVDLPEGRVNGAVAFLSLKNNVVFEQVKYLCNVSWLHDLVISHYTVNSAIHYSSDDNDTGSERTAIIELTQAVSGKKIYLNFTQAGKAVVLPPQISGNIRLGLDVYYTSIEGDRPMATEYVNFRTLDPDDYQGENKPNVPKDVKVVIKIFHGDGYSYFCDCILPAGKNDVDIIIYENKGMQDGIPITKVELVSMIVDTIKVDLNNFHELTDGNVTYDAPYVNVINKVN